MRSTIKWLLVLYVVLGIITMAYQVPYRYPDCSGAGGCGLSFTKGIVWSAIWPIYSGHPNELAVVRFAGTQSMG